MFAPFCLAIRRLARHGIARSSALELEIWPLTKPGCVRLANTGLCTEIHPPPLLSHPRGQNQLRHLRFPIQCPLTRTRIHRQSLRRSSRDKSCHGDSASSYDATKRVPSKRSGRAKFHLGLSAAKGESTSSLRARAQIQQSCGSRTVGAMAQKKEPDPKNPSEEWEAVSRQSKALEDIDKLIRSDEPAGEKLKKIVDDHGAACDEIKGKLASSAGNSSADKT